MSDEPIYRQVQRDLEGRANVGKEQYGEHLTADTKIDGLQYLYEELLDGSNYIRKAMEDRRALIEYVARLEGAVRYAKRQFDSHAGEDIPSEIMSEVLATSPLAGQPQPAPPTGWRPIAEELERLANGYLGEEVKITEVMVGYRGSPARGTKVPNAELIGISKERKRWVSALLARASELRLSQPPQEGE